MDRNHSDISIARNPASRLMPRGFAAKTRSCILATAAAAAALFAVSAHASCADPRALGSSQLHAVHLAKPSAFHGGTAATRIAGTWLVTYSVGGSPIAQAFIQWHKDGTEWENINFPVESGNLCMGSWKTVDSTHVSRNHFGWLYTAGLVTGYFNDAETVEVMDDGTYTGVADLKIFDLDGNLLNEFPETSSATIISP